MKNGAKGYWSYLFDAAKRGVKWYGVVIGVFISILTIDGFIKDYDLPIGELGYLTIFGIVPLLVFFVIILDYLLNKLVEMVSRVGAIVKETSTPQYLFELNNEMRQKVRHANWTKLSQTEKEYYYNQYTALTPRAHTRNYRSASIEHQTNLQQLSPIDVALFNKFLDSLGIPSVPTSPMSQQDKETFHKRYQPIIEAVINISSNGFEMDQKAHLVKLYNYLSCTELYPSEAELRSIDICVVPGARWSLQQRSDEAIKIQRLSGCSLLLVGGCPAYEKGQVPPISESEAMYHYITNKPNLKLDITKIYVETRSTSSIESLTNSLPIFNDVAFKQGRPLSIGLVTSSYHARRFYLQAMNLFLVVKV